jgi:hypothetical protein
MFSWFLGLFQKPTKTPQSASTPTVVAQQKTVPSSFWKSFITARFRPGMRELTVYFCVTRSATRAQRLQQAVIDLPELKEAECKAEILRLVGWEFHKPHITLEIISRTKNIWECSQVNELGIREPFGYVVLSTVYVAGMVNSLTVSYEEVQRQPVRFLLSENSTCLKLSATSKN